MTTVRTVRTYGQLALLPLGFASIMYGDLLFRDGQQGLGKFLFISGWVVALSGMPALNRYLKANHLREGILKIFVILFIVGSFAVPGPIVSLVKVFGGTAQPVNYRQAALSLALIYIALTITSRIAEPKDHVLERLASRIQRAAVFRALANVTGIFAVVAFLGARFVATHPVPLISTGLTLVVAAAVVTHKTFARARKLCTQIHADTQTLLRDLDELDQARSRSTTSTAKPWIRRLRGERQAGGGHADEQKAALRAWDAVKLGLSTPVDTGYRRIGLPFLTDEVVAEIEAKVRTAVHGGSAGPARADLQAIQRACSGRVDVLA
ncbi:hypothetical protein [Streptomyces sp. SS1-1]|uniref:hypothetical protein n=1 Tax=Streptomyces sp. SS1-1 TaxID=2651869 RepID=UPI0012505822|nr:hypothetical protein [Streptomyces sp. SS1-1]KAB2975577.1 hypothetical protein F8R89_28390 [Streptomyces sp. SS1-1]